MNSLGRFGSASVSIVPLPSKATSTLCRFSARSRSENDLETSRRESISYLIQSSVLLTSLGVAPVASGTESSKQQLFRWPSYEKQGPCNVLKLPRLEHTCTVCNIPADRGRIRICAWAPQGGSAIQLRGPFPLVIITPGFLISADQYTSYAERLASWGYVVVSYDFVQQALDPTNDLACVDLLEELILWCGTSIPLGRVCDADNVMLVGHSRGAKIATLAAIQDSRVKCLCLVDPVDVTVYAPLSAGYPSATDALKMAREAIPVCIVGGGKGGDCAPLESNYDLYYKSSRGPTWKAVIEEAGHLQFIDSRASTAMGLVCQAGSSPDVVVGDVTKFVMVSWAESILKRGEMQRIVENEETGQLTTCRDAAEGIHGSFTQYIAERITEISPKKTDFQFKMCNTL